jgi:phosphatidylglycerophosphatase A
MSIMLVRRAASSLDSFRDAMLDDFVGSIAAAALQILVSVLLRWRSAG